MRGLQAGPDSRPRDAHHRLGDVHHRPAGRPRPRVSLAPAGTAVEARRQRRRPTDDVAPRRVANGPTCFIL